MEITRRLEHRIDSCPHCGEAHVVALEVVVATAAATAGTVSFFSAGQPVAQPDATEWSVGVVCAKTGKGLFTTVPVVAGADERVVAVRLAAAGTDHTGHAVVAEPAANDLLAAELAELVKQSSATGRDFGKTMLTASLTAIPAVFAVAKFLGVERVGGGWTAWTGAGTALLFLLAAAGFAAAMRPWHTRYTGLSDYATTREERVATVNRFLIGASVAFGLAAVGAIGLFVLVLVRP